MQKKSQKKAPGKSHLIFDKNGVAPCFATRGTGAEEPEPKPDPASSARTLVLQDGTATDRAGQRPKKKLPRASVCPHEDDCCFLSNET